MEGGGLSVGSKLQPQYNSAPVYGKRLSRLNARTKNALNFFFFKTFKSVTRMSDFDHHGCIVSLD
jgi:hypothetical protein